MNNFRKNLARFIWKWLGSDPIVLDLKGKGIRSLGYDPVLDTFLIVNEADNGDQNSEPMTVDPQGSQVILRNRDAWGDDASREARVSKLIGSLDQQSRLARVLITVEDPLSLKTDAPPLILQTLLETEIVGKPIEDVVRLERSYVRDGDTVWVMSEEKLEIREVKIEFQDAQYAYIRSGLEDGDEVVITTLATVADGIGLRKVDPEADKGEEAYEGETTKADVGQT